MDSAPPTTYPVLLFESKSTNTYAESAPNLGMSMSLAFPISEGGGVQRTIWPGMLAPAIIVPSTLM